MCSIKFKFLIISVFSSISLSFAQEIQFSNVAKTLNFHNPALSGANYAFESQVVFRNQWRNSSAKFQSMAGGIHGLIQQKNHKGKFALGLNFYQDENSQKTLKISNIQANLAYHFKVSDQSQISSAIYVGLAGINFNPNNGSWASQHDGIRYDENISNGENTIVFNRQELDAGFGFVFTQFEKSRNQNTKNVLFQSGISLFHTQNIFQKESYFPYKTNVFASLNFRLKSKTCMLSPIISLTNQQKFIHLQVGLKFEKELKDKSKQSSSFMVEQNNAIGFGIYATKEGNIVNAFYFSNRHLEIYVNYDYFVGKTNSSFSKSAFEIGLAYRMKSLKPSLKY